MRKGVLRILGKLGLVPVSTLNAVQHNCEILRRQRAALKAENKSLKDKANRPQNWMQRIANGEDFFDSYFAEFPSMKSKYRLCLRSFIHSLSRENDLLCSFDTFSKLADAQFMYSEKFYKRTLQILDQIPKSMILRYLPYTYLDSQVHENCLDIDELTKLINRYIGESNIAEALRYAELLAKAGKFNLFYEKIDQLQKYSIDSEQIQNQIQWYKNFKKENENSPGGGLVLLSISEF